MAATRPWHSRKSGLTLPSRLSWNWFSSRRLLLLDALDALVALRGQVDPTYQPPPSIRRPPTPPTPEKSSVPPPAPDQDRVATPATSPSQLPDRPSSLQPHEDDDPDQQDTDLGGRSPQPISECSEGKPPASELNAMTTNAAAPAVADRPPDVSSGLQQATDVCLGPLRPPDGSLGPLRPSDVSSGLLMSVPASCRPQMTASAPCGLLMSVPAPCRSQMTASAPCGLLMSVPASCRPQMTASASNRPQTMPSASNWPQTSPSASSSLQM